MKLLFSIYLLRNFSVKLLLVIFFLCSTTASTQVVIIFQENWESGIGNWGVTNGLWEVGVPTAGPDTCFSPPNCAGTVLGGTYPNATSSRLESPINPRITLPRISAGETIQLKFWHWFSNNTDRGVVQISVNNGQWKPLAEDVFTGFSHVWTQYVADISAYADSTIRIGFLFESDNAFFDTGWYIDDIVIEKKVVTLNCPETFEKGVGDWSADNGLWEVGVPSAGPDSCFSTPNCAGTVLSGTYPNAHSTRFISPEIKITPLVAETPILRFWHWFQLPTDAGVVEISTDRGPFEAVAGPFTGSSVVWTPAPSVDLSAFSGSTIRIAFRLTSDNAFFDTGWYIDDIRIDGIRKDSTCIAASAALLNFGNIFVGLRSTKQVEVTNCGTVTLNLEATISGNDPDQFDVAPKSLTLLPNDSAPLDVAFEPDTVGSFRATLEISSNGENVSVPLSGNSISDDLESVPSLFNTGVDDLGDAQPPGSEELHYALIGSAGPASVIDPLRGVPGSEWVDPPAGSAWIGPSNSNMSDPVGDYSYKLEFDLTGFDISTITISGDVASDNTLSVFLNGVDTGFSGTGDTEQFRELRPLTISSGFISGISILEFRVTNLGGIGLNPTGLLVANLSGRAKRLGPCPNPSIASITDVPNDQGKQVTVLWNRACPDTAGSDQPIRFYGVWRRADQIGAAKTSIAANTQTPAVKAVDSFDDMMVAAHNATPGSSYQVKGGNLSSTSEVWTFVGATPALQLEQYAFDAPTLFDSTAADSIVWSVFFISAHTDDALVSYASEPDSGYSVDNLIPTAPTNISVTEGVSKSGSSIAQLTWDESPDADFNYFQIVRGTEAGFSPSQADAVGKTTQPSFVDTSVKVGNEFFYRVVAFDFSGNRGELSEEVSLLITTVAGDPELQIPTEFALEQNYPNPFNPETSIQYQLPKTGHVELAIYNLLGEKIRTLVNEDRPAGIHRLQWDGNNDLGRQVSSGIYVYRIRSGEFVQTRKMILVR